MKTTFIATVFNEEENISKLLDSLNNQTKKADEIIICDGFSKDKTISKISNFKFQISKKQILRRYGNRSIGRNEAIKNATGDIIVCSDAGCILDKNWLKNITVPFRDAEVDVVAGYYSGKSENIFQKCLIPYVLVMPDRVNPENFLPATRSMAFRKSIWKKMGGFPEEFSNNEDYVFAKKLKKIGAKIVFEKKAIVHWLPRKNLREAYLMFFRFALGDAEAGIIRPKVVLIFIRYAVCITLLSLAFVFNSYFILSSLYFILLLYILWSVLKNFKYVKDFRALAILPVLQIVSDIAVITGTILGLLKIWVTKQT